MTRSRPAACLLLALAACPSPRGEATREPGGEAKGEAPVGGALPIVLVPQREATQIDLWTFEPGGARMASTEYGGCDVWDVASGRRIHGFEISDDSPCLMWPPALGLFELARMTSADERLELDGDEILGPDGNTLRTLACPHCADASGLSWSPTGHLVALLFVEPLRVEVWDADSGRKLVSEPVAVSEGEVFDAAIAWSNERPFVAWGEIQLSSECDDVEVPCEWDDEGNPIEHEVSVLRMQALGQPAIAIGERLGSLEILRFDPEARHVMWTHTWDERRAGTTDYVEVVALDGSISALSSETYSPYTDYEGSTRRYGEWRSDGIVHYGVSTESMDFEGTPVQLGWEELVVSPPQGRSSGVIAEGLPWGVVVDVATYGLVEAGPAVHGVVCESEAGPETCTSLGVVAPPDCELLDVGSGHGAELHDCGGRVMLRKGSAQHVLPLDAAATFWWWMRGGALVLDDGDRFLIVDAASGAIGLQREGVAAGLDGKLGPELDRMVLVDEQGLEVLDTRSLQTLTRIADPQVVDVAFAPAGDRIALLSEGEVVVHALPGGEPLGRFALPSPGGGAIHQIAFRQDGAALWLGDEQPLVLIDAASGQPREGELVAAITSELGEGGEIDPTWRFVANDEFGTLMRTLDARMLEWRGASDDTAMVPETGQYQGQPPGIEYAFRVGNDPLAVPEFDAESLAEALEVPDLVERFLRGEPIPAPTIDASELAAARARMKARGRKQP